MHTRKHGGVLLAAMAFALLLAAGANVSAQDEGGSSNGAPKQAARSEVNFEVQLHLLVTAEADANAARVPPSLEGVVKELKASLPPADYRLSATFINRVRNGATVEASNMGGSTPQSVTQGTPAYYQFGLNEVRLSDSPQGEGMVNVRQLRFSVRLPFQNVNGGPVQFQDSGLSTQVSVREGEPTLVGTLNTTRPGQFFVLVITIKRVK